MLNELEGLWNCVSLQVGWKLEECTKPGENGGDDTTSAKGHNKASQQAGNSPTPTNVSSPGTSGETPSGQTDDNNADVNTNETVPDYSHHSSQDGPPTMGTD